MASSIRRLALLLMALVAALPSSGAPASLGDDAFPIAAQNGDRVEEVFRRTRRMMHAWLAYADERTLLLPDYLPGYTRASNRPRDLYTPHNSGADNYPYLVATAFFTDRGVYEGRMRDMLRNEIRYTAAPDGDVVEEHRADVEALAAGRQEHAVRPVPGRRPPHDLPRLDVDHLVARPHAVVLSHGRHDRGPHATRAGGERFRGPARRGRGAERRRAADAGAAGGHDRRAPLPGMGGAAGRRVRPRGAAAQPRPPRVHLGLRPAPGP